MYENVLESWGFRHSVKVPQDKIHTSRTPCQAPSKVKTALPQVVRDVHVGRLQDCGGAVDVDGHQDLLLAKPGSSVKLCVSEKTSSFSPLESLDAELVRSHKEIHGLRSGRV